MKSYQIKKSLVAQLKDLSGFLFFSGYYDHLTDKEEERFKCCVLSLPRHCNEKLVHTMLEQIQGDKVTLEAVKRLEEYLKLAERNDHFVVNAYSQDMFRKVFLGLLYVTLGVVGFGLAVFLMALSQISANCALFLIFPAALVISWGIIKAMQGCVQCGINTFSPFSEKERERMQVLEKELFQLCSQPKLSSERPFFFRPVANDTREDAIQIKMSRRGSN